MDISKMTSAPQPPDAETRQPCAENEAGTEGICCPARRAKRRGSAAGRTMVSRRDRVTKRNRILTARYYYWTELRRRRFDDVLRILADDEFFVDERTVSNALIEQDDFYNTLLRDRIPKSRLRRMFPGFDWA